MPGPLLIPFVPAAVSTIWVVYAIISTAIFMTTMEKRRRDAKRALAKKNITITRSERPVITRSKRPKKDIPTYFWLFSQMSHEQITLVCFWMDALMKKFFPSGTTYTKWVCEKNEKNQCEKIQLALPTEVIKGSWKTPDNKTIEWWIAPCDEDGFIVEGDISWMNEDVRKQLPGLIQTAAEKRKLNKKKQKLNRIAEKEQRTVEEHILRDISTFTTVSCPIVPNLYGIVTDLNGSKAKV